MAFFLTLKNDGQHLHELTCFNDVHTLLLSVQFEAP